MTDLRQAAQQALEALETKGEHHPRVYAAITALRTALEQQAEPPPEWPLIKNILAVFGLDAISFVAKWQAAQQQAEPVSQAVIAGALFDFMGWLTTRKERLILSSTDNASPAADAIKVFAEMRGLSLDDARVQDWQNYTTQQQVEPTCPDCKAAVLYECVACSSNNYPPKQQAEPVAWQPIETAPKDGNAILVMRDIWPGTKSGRAEECNGHNTYVAAWWGDENNGRGAWVCYMDSVCEPQCPIEPTHWMPLPCPPSIAPPQQQAEPVTREGFEKWAKFAAPYMDISRFGAGYSDCNTDYAWAGWQAAQRQWVGLTDEDYKGISSGDQVVAMWADRTLKERNGY